MVKDIIDVSVFQTITDYEAAAKEVDGVIIRCGITFWGSFVPSEDESFRKHFNGFKATGIPIGVYYYGVARNAEEATIEAEKCIDILKGLKFELPVFYDVEEPNRQGDVSKEDLTEVIDTFCQKLEEAGYFVGFYTTVNWALNKIDYPTLAKRYASWIAWVSGDPAIKLEPDPAAWQFTWKASIPGIVGDVDRNYFYKDYASIIPAAGLNGYSKKEEPEEPSLNVISVSELTKKLKELGIDTIKLD